MNLKKGKKYTFTVIESDDRKPWVIKERTFEAEFRGFDLEPGYILLWEKGDTCGRPYHEDDIIKAI